MIKATETLFIFFVSLSSVTMAATVTKTLPAKGPANTSANKRLDRESFYLELKNELEKSLKYISYSRVEKSVRLDNELAKMQEPWSISNTAKYQNSNSTPRFSDTLDSLSLKYANQNGFGFQLTGDYYSSPEFGVYGTSGRYSKSNYSISVSQDLVSLFKKTSFEINQEITLLQGKAKLISNENQYLNDILKVLDMSFQLFSSICKKKDLEKILNQATDTLKSSEVQQAARTISMRDFLRIKGTYLSVLRQVQSAEYEISQAQQQFAAISEASQKKAQLLSKQDLVCEDDMSKLRKAEAPVRSEIQDILAKHPSILNIEVSKETLKKKFEAYKAGRNIKVELSGGYNKVNNETFGTEAYDQSFVGLSITYQFQGDYSTTYKQVVAEQYQDLSISAKQTNVELSQYLESLFNQLEFQQSQIPVVQESILTATRLLKIIETQQSIGQVDATAIESAYQGEIQAQGEKRNLWSGISSLSLKLQEIKAAANRAVNMR